MTNRDLLLTPSKELSPSDRQKQFELRIELTPTPCPACREPVSALAAARIDIDDFQIGSRKLDYRCPHCGAKLEQAVPLFSPWPGWHWHLEHGWLSRMLAWARAFDRIVQEAYTGGVHGTR